jgi:hypothetical protein
MNTLQILVPEERFDNLILRLQKFQRKASLLNVGRVDWTYSECFISKVENQYCEVRNFEIIFPEIKLGDWTIVGKIENFGAVISGEVHSVHENGSEKNKNLLSAVPGNDISEYEHWDCSCEHCGINRQRKRLFVVQNQKERKVVGVSCLKDFVGHDVKKTLSFYSYFLELQNTIGGYRFKQPDGFEFSSYVKKICGVVEQINNKNFKFDGTDFEVGPDSSTKYNVIELGSYGLTYDIDSTTEFVKIHSEKILSEIESIKNKNTHNDFEKKLLLFYDANFFPESKISILLGFIGRYFSSIHKKSEKKYDQSKSEFFGKIGEQIQTKIGIERAFDFESQYGGGVCIVGWVIGTNNAFIWFASGKVSDFVFFSQEEQKWIPVCSEYDIIATIKKHDNNEKFGKKTMLTRVRLVKK